MTEAQDTREPMSFPSRLIGIYTGPKAVCEELRERPTWVMPLLLVMIFATVVQVVVWYSPSLEPALREQIAESQPNLTPEQIDQGFQIQKIAVPVAVLVITRIVGERFGSVGILVMAAIMGSADVDPFILGLTQMAGQGIDIATASMAVVIAAATNNLMKGVYAVFFGNRRTGLVSLGVLVLFGAASVGLYLVL